MVVPTDLNLPSDVEAEKLAAHLLGLTFPFPVCQGDCEKSVDCFACHVLKVDEVKEKITARFVPTWRHWEALMKMRQSKADETPSA